MNESKIAALMDRSGTVPYVAPNRHVPLKPEKINKILELARCAPTAIPASGPWVVHHFPPHQREKLISALHALMQTVSPALKPQANMFDFSAFPKQWRSAWLNARFLHAQKYELADKIQPDKARLLRWYRNCLHFLDAPGHIFLTHRGNNDCTSFIEHGLFIKNIKWAGEMNGLGVTTFGLTPLEQIIRTNLCMDEAEHLVCGVAIRRH
jgi:nitroreductase